MSRFGTGKFRAARKKEKAAATGSVNQSQSVSTFGVGSLYEIRTQKKGATQTASVIISGIDDWPKDLEKVSEPDLCAMLGVDTLRSPPAGADEDTPAIPATRFPEWLVCNQCHSLGKVGTHFEEQTNGIPTCNTGCGGWGVPTRILTVCWDPEHPNAGTAGHIGDFPWVYWAHKHSEDGVCEQPQLELITERGKTGLDGLTVRCKNKDCQAQNSLKGALSKSALAGLQCSGSQPWLRKRSSECHNSLRALLRGASNVYFPVNASTISIPPNSSKLIQLLQKTAHASTIDYIRQGFMTISQAALALSKQPDFAVYEEEIIEAAINKLLSHHSSSRSEQERRREEREALVIEYPDKNCQYPDDEEFQCEVLEKGDIISACHSTLPGRMLDRISLVHRLREVRALRGFTRLESIVTANSYTTPCAPLSRYNPRWLPAVQNRGEGVYLELNHDRLSKWAAKENVQTRTAIIRANYQRSVADKVTVADQLNVTPAFILAHTLSHLLIKQLSLDCGYSSASLRERIYHEELYTGILIYTASSAADGTLGGLVRQGEPENLEETLDAALNEAKWCSSDPLCIESQGQGTDALNLAACHACVLISETSCEYRNLFLDRALLIGTPDDKSLGFFNE
ncbi:DrmB family protein [Photobacterium nomapromontoriensis]|uniref:DrmB family protein n=1 Tax=Photobacterium nomapromontoriensis TaxID=2910237 RepID=UPI003D0ED09A